MSQKRQADKLGLYLNKADESDKNCDAQGDLNSYLREEATKAQHGNFLGIIPCQAQQTGLYPNTDFSIWLRSCISEVDSPLQGTVTGYIPLWLCGNLLQNGPGKFYYGNNDIFKHVFDGSALLQKYAIKSGKVFYQCRFLRTESFKRNIKAGRIVNSEFGTNAKKAIETRPRCLPEMTRPLTRIKGLEHILSDNAMISVYPFDDQHYCFYESPFIQVI